MTVLSNKKIIIASNNYINYNIIIDSTFTGNFIEVSLDNGITWKTLKYETNDTLYSGGYRLFNNLDNSPLLYVNSNSSNSLLIKNQGETDYLTLYYERYYSGNNNPNGSIPFSHVMTYVACNGNVFFSQNIQDDGSYFGQPYRLTASVDGGTPISFEGHKIFEGVAVDIDPFYNFGTLSAGNHLFRLFFDGNEVYQYTFNVPLEYTCPVTTTTTAAPTTTNSPTTQTPTTTATPTTQAPPIANSITVNVISGNAVALPISCNGLCTVSGIKITQGVGCGLLTSNGNTYQPVVNNIITTYGNLQFKSGNCLPNTYVIKYVCLSSCGQSNEGVITINVLPQTTIAPTTQAPATCDPCTLLNVILQQVLCIKNDVHEIKCKMNKHSTIISY